MSDKPAADEPVRWDVPAIDGGSGKGYMTAGRLESIQKDAYEEAWKRGHADGLQAGELAAKERVDRLDQLLVAMARPFDELDEQIEKQLVELAMTSVRQLFRREISQEPTHVIGVVREAIQLLPIASNNVQVHLHPEDAVIIREYLSPAEGEPAWVIVEDPLTSKGGCQVTTENSQIDASAEARLNALIQSIAGDNRK
ncbi:MAG: FliH/SctL family protein [Gammaproteobacteria bacterium]|nr:FliH/SctL family protein [Gammaproteobacteria bacterium]